MAIITKFTDYHNLSPIRRFFPSLAKPWITIRRGDIQFYLFFVCFLSLYFIIFMYIVSTLSIGFFIVVIVIILFSILSMINDYLSNDKEEMENEKRF